MSDPGNQVARRFGLVYKLPEDLRNVYLGFRTDLPTYNGDDSWTLPLPARFVIDQSGIIRSAEVNADYTVRPEPEATIKILRCLAETSNSPQGMDFKSCSKAA